MLRRAVSQLERWRPYAEQVAEQHVSEENHEVWKMAVKKVEALRPSLRFDVVQAKQLVSHYQIFNASTSSCEQQFTKVERSMSSQQQQASRTYKTPIIVRLRSPRICEAHLQGRLQSRSHPTAPRSEDVQDLAVPLLGCPQRRCRWSLLSNLLFKGGTVCAAAPSCFSCTN